MVAPAVVLEVDMNSVSSETLAAIAGPKDIIQLAQSTTATPALTRRRGTKTMQPPQIAWAVTTSGRKQTGSSLPSRTTPATKASQPPGDRG